MYGQGGEKPITVKYSKQSKNQRKKMEYNPL